MIMTVQKENVNGRPANFQDRHGRKWRVLQYPQAVTREHQNQQKWPFPRKQQQQQNSSLPVNCQWPLARGRRITEKVSICDKPPKQRQRAPPRSRRHSLLSIHSEDHDADALQSLTSSTSFLNQSDNRNDRSEIEASDIPVRNYSVANTTPRAIAAMNPETLVSSSVSNSENHFHTMMTSATSSHPQDAYSNDHERQYSQSEFCNQQQPNQQECFQQSHDQSHNFYHFHQHSYLVSQMLELERQYQRSIKRITNSMMQSQNTKWMLQMNGTSIRRRSSLTVGSYRSYGEKSHSRRESQTKLQRRKSSLQFSSKVIYIPNEPHEQEGVDETPNDKTDEDVDFQSTTMSEASDLMSAKRRRSSTSTVVSILKTSADPNSSSQIWSNDDDDDNRNFQSHDDVPASASASASAPPATATAPNDSTLPNHQNRPYSMRFQPSTNVEVTREMLYHMLRSSSDGFMWNLKYFWMMNQHGFHANLNILSQSFKFLYREYLTDRYMNIIIFHISSLTCSIYSYIYYMSILQNSLVR